MSRESNATKLMAALFMLFTTVYHVDATCVFSSPLQVKDLDIGNLITWNTIEEKDNELFIVQKSLDGIAYTAVGQVSGAGNSSAAIAYRFLDPATGAPKAFYRLAQLDTQGKYSYTEAVKVQRKRKNNYVINVMSATSTERFFTANITSEIEAYLEYRLLNQSEVVVKSGATHLKQGENTFSLDLKKQPVAKYRLEFLMQEEKETVYLRKVAKNATPALELARKQKKE